MKKSLFFGAAAILVVALGAYVTLQFFLGSIVKAGVNRFGPGIMQTKVELAGASISPLSGAGTLSGLTVGNPRGWSGQNAFHFGRVHIKMEPFSVFRDHIVINEIVIEEPEFVYETKIVASNIGDLLKNIEQSTGGKGTGPATKTGRPVKMVIRKLLLRNGHVTLGFGPAAMTMPMPDIEMTEIGTAEDGVTPAQVAFAVMRGVTSSVATASAQAMMKVGGTSGAAAAEAARQAGDAIKGLFGGKKKH